MLCVPALWALAVVGAGIAAAAIAIVAFMPATFVTDMPDSPQPASWTQGSPVPTPRTEVAAATAAGKIFVIGGFDRTGSAVPTVEAYDPEADEWRAVAPLPIALHHTAAASHGDMLYVVGGYLSTGEPSSVLLVYDPSADSWEELAPMPAARGALAAAFVNGILHAVGGTDTGFGRGLPLATNHAYDPETDTWEEKAPLPTPRQHLAATEHGGKLYVVGGRIDGLLSNLDANEAYDPKTDSWEQLRPMPSKRGGLAAAATDAVYVFGGEQPMGTFANAERYGPENDVWTAEPPMPTARHGLGAVALDGRIYVLAGGPQPGLTVSDTNEILK